MPIPTILTDADAGAPVLSGSEGALLVNNRNNKIRTLINENE